MRLLWIIFGLIATAAGIAGIVLPLVPATPFLLLAAYAFARSSPVLHNWLISHARLGPPIANWQRNGAIDRPSKIMAIVLMAAALTISVLLQAPAAVLGAQAAAMAFAATFILTRPHGPDGGT
ncbi:MAG: YbaN family protein [Hyphomicrobium sp.]|nr:YbaN family protein [Hyphomicrobium sp.]